jgi:hypothetical protein
MEQEHANSFVKPVRVPWNKGKLVGAKPPLRPSHVWSIRTKLQIEGKRRDLALFNLAIDSELRRGDVVTRWTGQPSARRRRGVRYASS